MTPNILKGIKYAVSADHDAAAPLPGLTLATAFRQVATKKGFEIETGAYCGTVAYISTKVNVPFSVMEKVMEDVSEKFGKAVHIAPEITADGKPADTPDIVKREAFLTAIPKTSA